jgi:hypothetical protein
LRVVPVFGKGAGFEMRAERLSLEAYGVEADFNEGEAKVQELRQITGAPTGASLQIVDGSGVPYHEHSCVLHRGER